ncbi:hypothetical protein BGZ73_007402 [Actinomortierella ambigua]|nr:hypothetical protein BGZ73_007402 [Actinomortierella ambigua]
MLVRSLAILGATASLAMAGCTLRYTYTDGTTSDRDVEPEVCYTVPAGQPKDVKIVDVFNGGNHGSVETYGKRGCRTLLESGETPLEVTKRRIYSVYVLTCASA